LLFLFFLHVNQLLIFQLLRGLEHLHAHGIIHRDLKPHNILVQRDSLALAIADMGMSRPADAAARPLTEQRCTPLYRAPEVFLGADQYHTPVDIWAAGCVFAEMFLLEPLFNYSDEFGIVRRIFGMRGSPTAQSWPGHEALPLAAPFKRLVGMHPPECLSELFPRLDPLGLDLLERLLTLDPAQRITARAAVSHPYFAEFDVEEELAACKQASDLEASKARDAYPRY
jgi:cyclin-dependent kinase 2